MTRTWLALALLGACAVPVPQPAPHDEWDDKLAERVVDYSAALRIAALRLTGELPTLAEIKAVASAPDPRVAYEAQLAHYMEGPRFARQMFHFWQDAMKMGDAPELDSAPAFVASLVVNDQSFLDAFTARTGTCPTFDASTGVFTPGECGNAPITTGLLTHPGMNKHLFSNFGFRRVRWVQETFACTAFPAELALAATDVGGAAPYTGAFPFTSIAGAATGGRVDFRNTSSVICANCHSNINHIAPLFAHFDDAGVYKTDFAVPTPLPDAPPAAMSDYLPAGEPLAWRHDATVSDMAGLGAAMAADPDIAACAIARLWNWALGKPDIVDSSTRVPPATIDEVVTAFRAGGYKLRGAIRHIFTHDDFIKF